MTDVGENYAQGWSLIYFLRQTKSQEWKNILPTYFQTLKSEVTKWLEDSKKEKEGGKDDEDGGEKDAQKALEEALAERGFIPPAVEERARKKALDAAFGDFDDKRWERFESEWKSFDY